ncbi:sugar phosphate isomerase/epimerase family protein [Synoicihabitans lomoniglobus]|uniref:Sugar phosphate isomerase/epimerase n=1 Tax=Synoicihabitans lomoniglobus TaxID=2909285 RepID=A0AAF0I6G4_9BACT|nr:sugar phosphate isomerase/epimerase [Opitutaceae bacterium LMO-M01]WED66076.1 sugar phosphate isomerase/epimerase [Opitutaceae bacterium LMO-M01]
MKPKLAAFPKCFMDELCVDRTMSLAAWIDLAAGLEVDGLEFYVGFLQDGPTFLAETKRALERHQLAMPMLCCSPDFTQPDPVLLQREIERERRMIELTAYFGGRYCRVLSGQRRPEVTREVGVDRVVGAITSLLPFAEEHGVVLTMENHYKDNYWVHPEFAQKMDVFVEIVNRIDSPWFGVNFDPSNTILAGEDPLELLEQVKHRVVTMHASDRYLKSGTIEDLRAEEDVAGYADRLAHGVIGRGMNDYDKIFSTLAAEGFDSWISIEDGMDGMDDLRESVRFLREKIDRHFAD